MGDAMTIIALGALVVTILAAATGAAWAIRGAISGSVGRVHTRLSIIDSKMDANDIAARDRSDAMKSELLERIDAGDRYLADRVTVVESKLGEHVNSHRRRHQDTTATIRKDHDHA